MANNPINYGGGLGGLNAQADAGYGMGGYDNALTPNIFENAGRQKMANDIAVGDALTRAQENQRISQQNYSNDYTQGLIDYINNTVQSAQAAGASPENALRAGIGSFRDTFQDRLSSDAAAKVNNALADRAKVLASSMAKNNNIDGANALLNYAGVPGVGISPIQKYALQGNNNAFDDQLKKTYPDIANTYDPNTQMYSYGGVSIPRAMVMGLASQEGSLPFMLNSYAARQLSMTKNPLLNASNSTDAGTPPSPFDGNGIGLDSTGIPVPPNRLPTGPLDDHSNIMRNFVTANIMTQDMKNINTDLLQPAIRGDKEKPSSGYLAQMNATIASNPYNILRTAYAQANGDVGKTSQAISVVVSNLTNSLQDTQLELEREQNKSPASRNNNQIVRLATRINETRGMINSLQAGDQWLQTNINNKIDPSIIDPQGANYGDAMANTQVGVSNAAPNVPDMVTPTGVYIPGGYRPANRNQEDWANTAKTANNNVIALRQQAKTFNDRYANPEAMPGVGPMNSVDPLVEPLINTSLSPRQIVSTVANENGNNLVRTTAVFELLKQRADSMLVNAKDPTTIKRANLLKQKASSALDYLQNRG